MPTKILAIATASPPLELSQQESLDFILEHFRMKPSTATLYRRVFQNATIEKRSFGLASPHQVLEDDLDQIHARYRDWAVRLSAEALRGALSQAQMPCDNVTFLATGTCTGMLCPGLSSYVMETCGLRRDLRIIDAVGMGCGAALPVLEQAANFLAAHPGSVAATLNTEICSAAMFSDDAAELVISNAIFADGSAACLLSDDSQGNGVELVGFRSLSRPEWRDHLRFRQENGRLRNVLSKEVPAMAAELLAPLVRVLLAEHELHINQIDHWVIHSGGAAILERIQTALGLSADALRWSRQTLRTYGNLSSPSVLFTLKDVTASRPRKGSTGILASFGAGFTAHAALIRF